MSALILTFSCKAQNFNYQVQTILNQSYESIVDTTAKTISSFESTNQLPIGFSYNFAGRTIDSLKIKPSGLLTFDLESKYNFIFLNKEFEFDTDTSHASSVFYKLDIADSINIHILKVEFKNMLLVRGTEKLHFNFQVWLYQYNNAIEFHMGTIEGTIPNESCLMGLINMNNTSENAVGYLLQGDIANPSGIAIEAQGNLVELTSLPATGTIYKFTPSSN